LEQIVAQTRTRLGGEVPTARRGSCRCTTKTHGRSPRAGWESRSSSVTRHRSPTTPMASSWTSPCTRATRLTQDCSCRRSDGSPHCSHERHEPSPPIAAMARRASRTPWSHSREWHVTRGHRRALPGRSDHCGKCAAPIGRADTPKAPMGWIAIGQPTLAGEHA
jgi:hypothetical protein